MQTENNNFKLQTAIISFFLCAALFVTAKSHGAEISNIESDKPVIITVKSGEYLGLIASKYDTTVKKIAELNNIEDPDHLNPGIELLIPSAEPTVNNIEKSDNPVEKKEVTKKSIKKNKKVQIEITIPKGVTLSKIANTYKVPLRKIISANKIKSPNDIKYGQKLIIPGVEKEIELLPPPPCYSKPVEFYRVKTDETKMISLTFCNGKVNPAGIKQLSELSYPVYMKEMPFPLHDRLAKMLQKIANKFDGNRIEVISGQRISKIKDHESYHTKGQAIDFRVQGISNKKLVSYVKSFKNRGVGYYPNSVFIHMDTREKDAQWIDYSRPGEKPIYGKADMTVAQLEAIRQSRLNKENLAKLENSDFDEENLDNTIPASEKDSEKNENENQNQDALKAAIVKTDIQEQLEKQINENIKNGTDSIKSLSEQPVPAPIEQS